MARYRFGVILLLLAALYLGTIWQRPLFVPDEIRYSEIPREMIASGNWVVPQFNGMDYFEKPVLGYWLIAGAMKIFGEQPGAVRFPGALATLLSAGLIWLLGIRAGDRRLGGAAAVIFLLSGLVFAVGTFGVLDSPFSLFVLLMMTAVYFAYTEERPWARAGFLAVSGIGCGLAFLSKGLLAVAFPVLAMVPFLIWERKWKRIFTLPWIPLAVAAMVVAPWAWAVHREAPDFWHQFIVVEHIQRGTTGMGANDDRSQPFWYFIPVLLVGALPWLFFLPAIWRGYRRNAREFFRLPLIRFAVCMAAVWFVALSMSSGKLGTYILPCFPAIAILLAFGLLKAGERGDYLWVNRVLGWLVWILLPVPLLVFLLQTTGRFTRKIPAELMLYNFNENYFMPVLALVVMLVWFRLAQKEYSGERKFAFFCVGLGFAMLVVHSSMPWRFIRNIAPEPFLSQVVKPLAKPGVPLLADRALGGAACWALKRNDIAIYDRTGEFNYGLTRPGNEARHIDREEMVQLYGKNKPFLLITRSEKRVREVPNPKTTIRSGSLFVVVCHMEEAKGGAQ